MRALIFLFLLLLTGCGRGPEEPLNWMTAPSDPQVRAYAMHECLSASKGPQSTHYNDWDEAIDSCNRYAVRVSSYCPAKARCTADLVSLEDVRKVIP